MGNTSLKPCPLKSLHNLLHNCTKLFAVLTKLLEIPISPVATMQISRLE